MDQLISNSWWILAVRGVAALLFGIIALIWPGITQLVFVATFGAYALISGAISVIGAVRHRREEGWWAILLLGIVGIAASAIAVLNPGLTLFVLVLLIAAHAVVTGILDIFVAIRLRKEIEREWLLALAGAISIVFGVLASLFPTAAALVLVFVVGLYTIVIGVLLLTLAFRARKWAKRFGALRDSSTQVPRGV